MAVAGSAEIAHSVGVTPIAAKLAALSPECAEIIRHTTTTTKHAEAKAIPRRKDVEANMMIIAILISPTFTCRAGGF